ncbi:hypothetical protein NIIDNTM18_09930 [Mycolicibacterium litorale]|uniref:O-antigen/teichoic acid export membrane protein n=2 Tax=Mycolicibacterium litorale TaxID=758802 RepID=A0A6S6P033_9MYCO|nr:hypothetical protein NIIDNTM18_09930 [Mycolicibacterium litorale]
MIFIALLPMLTAIIDFGFSKAVGRFYFDNDESAASLAAFLARAIWLRLAMFAVLILPVLLGLWMAWPLLTGGSLPPSNFLALLTIACLSEAVILGVTAFSRARHVTLLFGIVRLGQGVLTVGLSFALAGTHDLIGAAIGLTAANVTAAAVAFGWCLVWISRQPRLNAPPSRFADARRMTRYGAPVVVHDLSWWIRNSSTLIILSHFVNAALVGAYSIAFAALSLISMLSWSLDFAVAPYYYRWRKREVDWRANTRDILGVTNAIIFILASTGILLFADVRSAFFGSKFEQADQVAPLLLIAGMLQPLYFMTVKPYFYLKRTALLSSITFTTSAIAVTGTIVAVHQWGFLAAAAMTIISINAIVVVGYWLSLRLEPAPFKLYRALAPAVLCCGLAVVNHLYDIPLIARTAIAAALVTVALLQIVRTLRTLQSRNAFQT